MCDPLTILSTALTVGAKAIGGVAGFAAQGTAAAIAKGNADIALLNGNLKENQKRAEVDRVIGAGEAHFAANNLDPRYGSPLLAAGFSASQGELDARLIRADAVNQAEGFKNQATADKSQGIADLFSGFYGAGTTLLSAGIKGWQNLPAKPVATPNPTFGGLY